MDIDDSQLNLTVTDKAPEKPFLTELSKGNINQKKSRYIININNQPIERMLLSQ